MATMGTGPDFTAIFAKTSQQSKFEEDWRKARDVYECTMMLWRN